MMETAATVRIPVASRRQAMDWSLVLASQGIETQIEHAEETDAWSLQVAAAEEPQALEAIRLYRLENRRWPWRRELFRPGLMFDWASLAWVLLIACFYWLGNHVDLETGGAMDSSLVARGQWWRLFTAVWLHADVAHLASNATIGVILLGLAMGHYGTTVGLLAAYLAGAGGNVAAWLLSSGPHHSLGASGMVMGGLGLLGVQSLSSWRKAPLPAKQLVSGIAGGLMLFVLLGVAPGTDVLAHFGGFASGLVIGLVPLLFALGRKPSANLICGLVFVLLVVVPWWCALHG